MKDENRSSGAATVTPEESSAPEPQANIAAEEVHTPFICLPYKGEEGESIINKFKKSLKEALPSNVKPRVTFKGTKLGSCFRIKDKVPTSMKRTWFTDSNRQRRRATNPDT